MAAGYWTLESIIDNKDHSIQNAWVSFRVFLDNGNIPAFAANRYGPVITNT
jgi:hypothetical protein